MTSSRKPRRLLPPEVWEQADRIPGWLTRDEAAALYVYTDEPWCEIGAWYGRSTTILGHRGYGYTIDWFKGNPETRATHALPTLTDLENNVAGLPVVILTGDFRACHEKVPRGLRFLYLDADHGYDETVAAFNLYTPKLRKGGRLAVHDANWTEPQRPNAYPGVSRFAAEIRDHPDWQNLEDVDRLAVFRKR